MPEQLSLAGLASAAAPTDRLFFGIFPDSAIAVDIARLAHRARDDHRLSGKPLATDRFHITLHLLGDFAGLPTHLVDEAKAAAASIAAPPFPVTFDRAASFSGKPRNLPFVLRGDAGLTALIAFQRTLFTALQRSGLVRRSEPNFTPHVTLLYDDRNVLEHPVEPVSWQVREFVLIHSLLGQTRHIPLARWSLAD